jgi:hypothetical protein
MPQPPDFDLNAAHRYFAAACFNRAWDFIDKPQRSPAEDDEMLHLNLTSLWHWSQRSDATPTNLSVGYCQVGRVYALQGEPANALHYAMLSLQASQAAGVEPVYRGYAYEALALAEARAGSTEKAREYLRQARAQAEQVENLKECNLLLKDLDSIQV